jgi:hypothetical protein
MRKDRRHIEDGYPTAGPLAPTFPQKRIAGNPKPHKSQPTTILRKQQDIEFPPRLVGRIRNKSAANTKLQKE